MVKIEDWCVLTSDAWTEVRSFKISKVTQSTVEGKTLFRNGAVHLNEIVHAANGPALFINPYSSNLEQMAPSDKLRRREAAQVRTIAGKWIHEATNKAAVTDLIAHLINTTKIDPTFIEGCIKASVAVGHFTVSAKGTKTPKIFLGLSEQAAERERVTRFASGFADELAVHADRVELLIRHWPTVGSFREELFRNLLQKAIPQRFHVATGFVLGIEKQFDILIYDRMNYAPLFHENDLVVIERHAVRAVIEVKSTLTHAELRSALATIDCLRDETYRWQPIFKGVFSYRSALSNAAILETVINYYDVKNEDFTPLSALGDVFSSICVYKDRLIASGYENTGKIITPTAYAIENVGDRTPQAALFFDILRPYLRDAYETFDHSININWTFESELFVGEKSQIYSSDWGPYLAKIHDSQFDEGEVTSERKVIDDWLGGKPWLAPPPRKSWDPSLL